uniref:Transcription factor Adf-1-like n=1 Tax=Sinocyclocheilus grahami TaxID=75366 RepID=A0A672KB78_SINGR
MAEAEELIQSVCAYPLLYNASLLDYRSAERRVKAWREVAASIGLSGQCVNITRYAAILYPQFTVLAHVRKKKRVAEHPDDSLDECSGGDSKPGLETDEQFESKLQPVTQLPPGLKLPQPPAPTVTSELHGKTEKEKEAFDEDELFLLSYVPALKRLTPQKRAAVKMQIQQIMFDAEFKEQL